MSGYIGTKASVVTPGAERKKVFSITTTTTSLTGLVYTPGFVHVFHNGVRLVDGTDYTATNGTSITLTTAAQNGDEVVVISYATFQTSDTVSASAGGTFNNDVAINGDLTVDTNTLFVDAANNRVGVGTSSPAYPLHVNGRISYSGAIGEGADTTLSSVSTTVVHAASATWQNQAFYTAGSERMRIDSSGNVGIGVSSPTFGGDFELRRNVNTANLDIYAAGDATPNNIAKLRFYNNADNGAIGLSSNALVFYNSSASTERMRINSSGHLIVPAGVTLGTSAGVYNAANTLDDYEEGTWTPLLLGSASNPTSTAHPNNGGNYIKVGNLVFIRANVYYTSISGGSGSLQIGGLPFSSGAVYWQSFTLGYVDTATNLAPTRAMTNNADFMYLWRQPGTSVTDDPITGYGVGDAGSSLDLYVSGCYISV